MRNTLFGLLATIFATTALHAAGFSSDATIRAELYQQQVRTALTKHLWRITQDNAGRLTAERMRVQSGPTGIIGDANTYARLMIDFRADGQHHTVAAARASLIVYERRESTDVGRTLYPPLALRDPRLTSEYREILAEAETQLASAHPTLAAAHGYLPKESGSSSKVVLN